MKIRILGVDIDKIGLDTAVGQIKEWLTNDQQRYVVTPNPEFVVAAQKNDEFREALNNADLAICDGIGLKFASGGKLERVTGVDLVDSLLKLSVKLYLLGGKAKAARKMVSLYSDANIVGAERGGQIGSDWKLSDNRDVIDRINKTGAEILLVGLGQVKQEMWIVNNLSKLKTIRVAVGVGGTFDYLSGMTSRAPKWIRTIGFEWLIRLLTQPQRLGRIWNATVKFMWLVIFKK